MSELSSGKLYHIIFLDNSVKITFSNDMYQTDITLDDLYINIDSSIGVELSWKAEYTGMRELTIELDIKSALQGNEKLNVKFINYKVFRGPYGG